MHEASKLNVKRVSLQERTLPVGNVVGINGYRVNKATLRKSIEDEGYVIHETTHFFVVMRSVYPSVIVLHWFAPAEIDARIGDFILDELKPLGALTDVEDFDAIFGAIVGSLVPHDTQQAWSLYTTNTFQQLRHLIYDVQGDRKGLPYFAHDLRVGETLAVSLPLHSTFGTFATLYRRVFELQVGDTFLDAGCSSGFLPLLIAEHVPSLSQVIGIDIRPQPFATARALAEEHGFKNVQFVQADLLDNSLCTLGSFDTITLLHVLEHFSEQAMYSVLTNLLALTGQRLIIAVPYEHGTPETVYGHEQLFSQAKLEAIGRWCIEQWEGKGSMWYEDCADGLLVIERLRAL